MVQLKFLVNIYGIDQRVFVEVELQSTALLGCFEKHRPVTFSASCHTLVTFLLLCGIEVWHFIKNNSVEDEI